MASPFGISRAFDFVVPRNDSNSRLLTLVTFGEVVPYTLTCKPRLMRIVWSLRSSPDDSRLGFSPPNDSSTGGTRLLKTIQAIRIKIVARSKELMKNFPVKLFSLFVGFYCATAFATVIGQTGDWDVLSAALMVAVVEGIGALMYNASLPLGDNLRNCITIFNYWKAGLSLGLFLDSFKY